MDEPIQKRENAEKDLNRQIVIQRLKDANIQIFLTMSSIIEGVILGYLLLTCSGYTHFHIFTWLNIYTTFMVIIIIWTEYMFGSTLFVYVPDLGDAITPFLHFVFQAALITFVNDINVWFLTFGAMNAISILTYGYLYKQVINNSEDNTYVLAIYRKVKFFYFSFIFMALAMIFGIIAYFASQYYQRIETVSILFSIFFALIINIYLVKFPLALRAIKKAQ